MLLLIARRKTTLWLGLALLGFLLELQSAGISCAARADESGLPEVPAVVLQAQQARILTMQQAAAATIAIFGLDGGGGGSGVIISPDGYALTNFHVSSACGDHMRCGLNDGQVYDAVIVGIDATGDVSLIKLLGRSDFPTAPLADSAQVQVGQWCFAAGNPFVLATNLQPSISLGIVSGVNRYQYPAGTLLEYADCIQTDAAINPGNSGGPLFSMRGEVIGINGRCSFEKRGRVNVGVGYAISANQIKNFLGMLKSGRLVDHATLGATVSTDDSGSVRVSNILSSSDAYRRGLRYGDEIVGLADREVRTTNNFKNILGTLPKDWRVPLTIRRDGKQQTLLVRLEGVHSEKQLSDLVHAETAQAQGDPQHPHGNETPPDKLQPEGGDGDGDGDSSDQSSPAEADPDQARGNAAEAPLEPGQPDKPLVASMLVERTGFANFYFNRQRRSAIWEQLQQTADYTSSPDGWKLTGSIAGETTPVSIELGDGQGTLRVGSRVLTTELADRMSQVVAQRGETGLLVALHALKQLWQLGPEPIGDTIYLGAMPVYTSLSTGLAEQPQHDVLQTLWYDAKVRFSFDPVNRQISLIEVFGDTGQDPIELYVDQYAPIASVDSQAAATATTKDSPRLFPRRLRLQYGTKPLLLLSIDEAVLGESQEKAAKAGDSNQAARSTVSFNGTELSLLGRPASERLLSALTRRNTNPTAERRATLERLPNTRSKTVLVATQAATETPVGESTKSSDSSSLQSIALTTEMNTVKLFGAGGAANLDAYQSGFFISAAGHVLTAWSTVLDVDTVIAVTSDGGRFESKVLGIDPNLEIAILATGQATNHYFDLQQAVQPSVGSRVLAFSNLYGIATGSEMSSVQKGVVMAKTELNARRGSFASVYQGPVLIIDAMTNNPGAAGGALTTLDGRLVGMLGKELRDASANTWLNYAIPVSALRDSVESILSGKSVQRASVARRVADRPANLQSLGIVLIPNVLSKTPAYVDMVEPNSRAATAGVLSDDLILFVNSVRITSQTALIEELQSIDRADVVTLLVQRSNELQELVLAP